MGREQYRSEPRPCELCGQLVVSVCDSLDMGDAVTCHYEPATEDEKAKRIAELEEENAALRSRLEFTSCQKADVEAQVLELEEQNAALRQGAAVGRALTDAYKHFYEVWLGGVTLEETIKKHRRVFGKTDITDALIRILNAEKQYAALEAAGLMEEEVNNA